MNSPVRPSVAILLTLALAAPSIARAQIEEGRVPLRTAVTELQTFRAEYADDYNKKDVAALTALFAPDAIVILRDGSVFTGQAAIRKAFLTDPAKMPHVVIVSDSMRVYGNTAMDQGTLTSHPPAGGALVDRYLVVLRRGMQDWKIVRLAVVPVAK